MAVASAMTDVRSKASGGPFAGETIPPRISMRLFIEPIAIRSGGGGSGDLGDGLAESRNPNRLFRLPPSSPRVEQRQALHSKLKDRNFLHDSNWTRGNIGHGSPKAYTALPAAIATYCFPSTAKAMGGA